MEESLSQKNSEICLFLHMVKNGSLLGINFSGINFHEFCEFNQKLLFAKSH